MSQNTVKIGIIGGGGIVRAHLPQLQKRSDAVELVALSDVNAQAAQKTAEEYGIPRHTTDYKEWLDDVDAVVIGVPTHLHSQIGIDCANAGKHIFMEKPMTRTREQADALLDAVAKNNVQMQVGFVRRFDDEWLGWRDLILQEKIGRPIVWRDIANGAGPANQWFNIDEMGGGPFLDGCIHNIDFSLFTFGPAEWAFCHGRTLRENNTSVDTGTATVRFQSGDELNLAWSWGLPKGASGNRIFEQIGPRGVLMPSNLKGGDYPENTFVIDTGEEKETVEYPPAAIQQAFKDQMDEFIEVARGGSTPRAGGAEGLESLKVALAILESARTQKVVAVK
jgi:predicted dehydrogenase